MQTIYYKLIDMINKYIKFNKKGKENLIDSLLKRFKIDYNTEGQIKKKYSYHVNNNIISIYDEGEIMKKIWLLLLFITSLMVMVACGGSTTSSSTSSTTLSSSTTESSTTTSEAPTSTTTSEQTTTTTTTTEQTTTTTTTTEQTTTTTEQTTTETTTTTDPDEPVDLTVSTSKPYIFINTNEQYLLSDYVYRTLEGPITLADAVITNVSAGLQISEGELTALSTGLHNFEFSYNDEGFLVYVFAKEASETDYLVYSMSFTDMPNGDLPEGYTIETIGGGSTGINNGYLYVDSPDIADPTRVLLPDYLKGFKNYIIEVDFSILSAVEETRWASVMFRFSTANYFQMAIRQGATATNGVEFAKAVNGQWNVPMTTAYSENINPASIYRLKIDLQGATAKEYINDELLIEYENARDYSNGHIGVQASGARAIYNNFEIRIPESYIDYTTIEYQNVPSVYTPDTPIIMAPTVIQLIETQEDIDQLQEEVRGSTALFDINPAFDAINDSSEVLLSFMEILESTKDKTIPAFRTRLPFVAQGLAVKLEELGVRDVVVISSNISAIQRARTEYNLIRGVLEIPYDPDKPVLTDADLLLIRNQTNIAGAVAVMLPIEYATKHNVDYLQRRLVSVWVDTANLEDISIYQGIVSGANGLLTNDSLNVYDMFQLFPENTMLRLPLIIGHRGMPSEGPENTVEGSVLAYEAGASIIELDVYLSLDNEIIVMHDTSTLRTTDGNLVVENSTLAELRELTIIDNFGTFPNIPVPTLEEYFQRFKGEEVVLFIEIKSTNANIVQALRDLIEEYDFFDQSVVITFHTAQAAIMRETLPEVSVGLLSGGLVNKDNLSSSVSAVINQIVPIKTTLNPYYEPITQAMLSEMQHRGITVWPWTINNPDLFLEQFVLGVGGITTDHSHWITDEYIKFWMPTTSFVYSLSNPSTVEVMGRFGTLGGFEYPFPATLQIISGAETGITFGTRNSVVSATSTGDVYILPSFTTTLSNGETITLYYDIVHIQIVE